MLPMSLFVNDASRFTLTKGGGSMCGGPGIRPWAALFPGIRGRIWTADPDHVTLHIMGKV